MVENLTTERLVCPQWLYAQEWPNTTSIEDLNNVFMRRNIPGLIFVSILMATGIVGNFTVLYIFWTRFARSNYRTYVICLAIIDEVSSCILMPFIVMYLMFPKHFPSNALCKFGHFTGYYTSITSAFLLILIAVDRYRKICQPLKRQISKKFAKRSCIIINVVGLVISVQAPVIYGTSSRPTGILKLHETICFLGNFSWVRTYGKVFYIQLQICLVFVIVFLTILYYKIMQKLNVHKQHSIRLSGQSSRSKTIRTRKTTLTFIVITLVFTVSSEIHHALAMILHFVDNLECYMNRYEGAAFYLFLWTVFINNVTNPFIYGVSDERFRRYLKVIFSKKEDIYKVKETVQSKSSLSE